MMDTAHGPVVRNKRMVPLSVEVEEFSLRTGPKIWVPTRKGGDGNRNDMPSREIEGILGRNKAVVSTTAVAEAVSPVGLARAVAPADPAGTDVPALPGMNSRTLLRRAPRPLMLRVFP